MLRFGSVSSYLIRFSSCIEYLFLFFPFFLFFFQFGVLPTVVAIRHRFSFPFFKVVLISLLHEKYLQLFGGGGSKSKGKFQKITHPWSLLCCYQSKGSSKGPKRRMYVFFSHTGIHTNQHTYTRHTTMAASRRLLFHLKAMV